MDTKFKYSGEPVAYELEGLKASTKYYFAIVAYNRWGKASAMSPVKEATTNAGPKVQVDKTTLNMTVDAANAPTAEASFNIKNAGEGMLKYQLTTATTRATMSTKARAEKPTPGQVVPFSGTVAPTLAKSNVVATSDYQASDWPTTLTYSETLYSYLGESDVKMPNALAQYFYVDKKTYPNGFNLTALKFQGHNGEDPVIEIYDGSRSISTASLIQKVDYSLWAYNYNITLGEQIYFAPGTSFWVVAKFPAGAKNPLGAGKTSRDDVAQYSFYSSNNGATWTQLTEVLKGSSFEAVSDHLTWAVQAISANPDWSQVLNPEPISGEVRPGESQAVTLKNDGQKLVNGTYKFNIHVKTNEAVDSKKKVALTMTVKGYLPELHSQQLIDFGNLLVGQKKTIDVELTNSGYGVFGGEYGYLQNKKNVKSSSDQFDVSKGMQNIAARSTGKLPVTFKPTKAGNFTSNITLTDKNGIKHTFVVRGVASATATLEVANSEFDLGDLKVGGETKTATVTLKNTGEYPLQYVFPKYSSAKIDGSTARVHKFGYTIKSNVGDDDSFEYEPAPELADGTSLEVALKGNVIGTPLWSVSPEAIEEETPYGVNVVKNDIKVTNNGDENLTFSAEPATWYRALDVEEEGDSQVDYVFHSKSDGFDVPFEWVDITSDYTEHMPYSYYIDKTDFKKVTLPFEFPFYGKKYKEMYIYNTGFVSFDAPVEDYKQFPEPPASLPTTETFYSNIICPFWGNHSMNTPSTDGVYYKANENDVVVSYKNYGNTMMQGMNFQVILRKDGSFKFQYDLDPNGFQLGVFGLCGIMDHSETRGITPADMYINAGNALEFTPYKNYVLAPGKSASLPIELLADKLADVYQYELNVKTNAPANESVKIPVTLNITGAPEPVFPEVVNVEQVVDENPMNPVYHEFTVENKGSKAFTIDDVASELFMASDPDDPWAMPEALLEVYTNANNGGGDFPDGPDIGLDANGTMAWTRYKSGMMEPIVVGKEPVKFRITLYNTYEVRQKDYPLLFTVSGLDEETHESLIKVNVTEAPALSFDQDMLYIENVASDYAGEATVNMKNEGGYKLNYTLRLDPSGHDEASDEFGGDNPSPALNVIAHPTTDLAKQFTEAWVAPFKGKSMLKALGLRKVKDDQKFFYDVPEGLEDNVLYYPVLNPVSSAIAALMGTGASALDENFYAATRYEAPAEGFNLTHLYFVGTVGDLENVDIEASVILGNDVTATEKTIGHGKIHVDVEEPQANGSYQGVPRMLKFDNPIYINPADTFYVVLKYPAGFKSSALMASKDGDMETNRYMAHLKSLGGWVDIEALYDNVQNTGAFGYFMTCVEHEKGEPWIKLLNEQKEGTLEAGTSMPLKFHVNAKSTYFAKGNKATLVVKSNDPANAVVNYHIYLDRNAAPAIEAPEAVVAASQGKTTQVKVVVADPEEEEFTVTFSDNKEYTTVASYNEADGVTYENGTFNVPEGEQLEATFAITPEYGYDNVGSGVIAINATDASGNASTADVNYNVVFTNRAPEYIGQEELTYEVGQQSGVISYITLFSDPDGDDFTCTASSSDSKVASVFVSEDGLIINAKKAGTTVLTLTATDANNGVASHQVTVNVVPSTGIAGVTADGGDVTVDADENGNVGVVVNGDVAEATLRLYNNAGQLVAQKTARNLHAGDKVILVANGSAGVYHLNAVLDGKPSNVKFAVK